jgi:hypothetical protein
LAIFFQRVFILVSVFLFVSWLFFVLASWHMLIRTWTLHVFHA